jgi:hypothetical protein
VFFLLFLGFITVLWNLKIEFSNILVPVVKEERLLQFNSTPDLSQWKQWQIALSHLVPLSAYEILTDVGFKFELVISLKSYRAIWFYLSRHQTVIKWGRNMSWNWNKCYWTAVLPSLKFWKNYTEQSSRRNTMPTVSRLQAIDFPMTKYFFTKAITGSIRLFIYNDSYFLLSSIQKATKISRWLFNSFEMSWLVVIFSPRLKTTNPPFWVFFFGLRPPVQLGPT